MTNIDTATTAQWVYQGAQKKAEETAALLQQSIAEQRALNRQKSDELKAMAAQQGSTGGSSQRRPGGIDVFA